MLRPLSRALSFAWRVVGEFQRNHGFLLAGALGYNTLLSIVPLLGLVVIVLSTIIDHDVLIHTIGTQADALLPGRAGVVTQAFSEFVERRATIGIVGFFVLLFFSAIAFRMLDEAFAMVFQRNRRVREPHRFRAFALPLGYVFLIACGIFLLTLVVLAFDALPERGFAWFGSAIDPDTVVLIVKVLAFFGLVALLSSFYWVMPTAHIRRTHAIVGGVVASVLWEVVRSIMFWYFTNLSLVDVVYGSLATVVVLLLGLEVAAIILMLGAQIIAELERAASSGRKWYEPPVELPAGELGDG